MPLDKDIRDRLSREAGAELARKSSSDGYYEKSLRHAKFDVNVLQYPSDLGSDDLLHYVEFGINVRGKSELNKEGRLFEVKRNPDSASLSNDELSTASTVGVGVAAGTIAGSLISQVLGKVTKSGSVKGAIATKAGQAAAVGGGAVLAGAAAGAAKNLSTFLKADTTYRISDVIALHVDGPPTVRYSMNYANKELGTLAGILSGSVFNSQNSGISEALAAFGTGIAKVPGMFGTMDVQAALSASSKTALNPFKEVVFESVDFRSFNFKYKFMPKNKAESEMIKRIIYLFKYHMHPEMSGGKLFFIYPSEFQITYYFGDKDNTYFHKFAPCVLEAMEVSYGGEQFSSFADGNPTEVNVTLTFRELEILTNKMIQQGY